MKRLPLSDGLSDRVESPGAFAQGGGGIPTRKANDSAALSSRTPLGSGRRLTPTRLVAVAEQLDQRALDVLGMVAKTRLGTGEQIRQVVFADVPSADRQARRTLAHMVDIGVLDRLDRQVGGRRAGSTGYIFALGLAGQRLVGSRGPAGGRRIERAWTPSAPYLRHMLRVTDLFVALTAANRRGDIELLEFVGEPACWRGFVGPAGDHVRLKPDAFVRLAKGEDEHLAFVEVDLATESPRALDRKLDRYTQYVRTGGERERWGVLPAVVWLVPDDRRMEVVADAFGRQPVELWPLFRVARFEDAVTVLLGGDS